MVRRRTLADDLAELTTTVPAGLWAACETDISHGAGSSGLLSDKLGPNAAEYDPEADVLHQNAKLEDSDDELLPPAASRQA